MIEKLKEVKKAKDILQKLDTKRKKLVLESIAYEIIKNQKDIIEKNQIDISNAFAQNLKKSMIDRLIIDKNKIKDMADAIYDIAKMPEPVGKVLAQWTTKSSLHISKVATPIGVIGIIYESRPNVTSDTFALCFKSSNITILKGGKEARNTNMAIVSSIQKVLMSYDLPKDIVTYLDISRDETYQLLKQNDTIDLIIPRGGESLISFVVSNTTIPVIKHDKGLCHTYIDKYADIQKAIDISIDAKCRRVEICGAMESLLVHKDIADIFLPQIKTEFEKRDITLKGCQKTRDIIDIDKANEKDFQTEYLDKILSIKIVEDTTQAIKHIQRYGSSHSDAIVSEDKTQAKLFLDAVDSACVYLNTSTQFTDGGEFGFGAEIGISTNKLHARGPMGLSELLTYKYQISSEGKTRA